MTRRTLLLLAAASLAALGCAKNAKNAKKEPAELSEPKALTVDEVAARIAAKDGKTFIYDNNDHERYARGHVPTARWVAFDKVTAADLPADKGATLVFYCAHEL